MFLGPNQGAITYTQKSTEFLHDEIIEKLGIFKELIAQLHEDAQKLENFSLVKKFVDPDKSWTVQIGQIKVPVKKNISINENLLMANMAFFVESNLVQSKSNTSNRVQQWKKLQPLKRLDTAKDTHEFKKKLSKVS